MEQEEVSSILAEYLPLEQGLRLFSGFSTVKDMVNSQSIFH